MVCLPALNWQQNTPHPHLRNYKQRQEDEHMLQTMSFREIEIEFRKRVRMTTLLCSYTPTTKCGGGGAILDSLCRVGRSVGPSVRPSVRPSPILVRSINPIPMEGFPSNLNDTFTSTRGCAGPMLSMCQLKVKVTVKGQIFNKQILHIMSCPLYNSFTNGRISFKLEWRIHLN